MLFVLNYQREEGFSLIEIMVGITILAVALIPILGYFINSTRLVSEAERRSIALNLAQQKIEELKSRDFTNLNDNTEDYGVIDYYPDFKRKIKVDSGGNSEIKEVTVIVYWNNDRLNIELKTLIANR